MSEQELINKIQSGDCNDNDITDAIKNFPTSIVLNYLIGEYYHKKENIAWKYHMYKCITLNKLFTFGYYKLCEISSPNEIIQFLEPVFNKRTIDYSGKTAYLINEQIHIASFLGPAYKQVGKVKNAKHIFLTLYSKLCDIENHDITQKGCWANICMELANLSKCGLDRYKYYLDGLNGIIDDKLIRGAALTAHYIDQDVSILQPIIHKTFNMDLSMVHQPVLFKNNKPRIGYLSPDFNKNAVGFFTLPLINNGKQFDVYCYYTNKNEDEFTHLFKNENWHDVSTLMPYEIYQLIRSHNIDILIDLLPFNHTEVINMKPAPIIINYLGFPDVTYMNAYTHRIVDKITDPYESKAEKLIYLDRTFICYNMFPNIKTEVYEKHQSSKIYIGIFNRIEKHSPFIKKIWKKILSIKKNYVLVFKSDDKNEYSDYPKNQIIVLPFAKKLEEYLDYYNKVDFCIDTFPYSGTTTTCAALYMGVPTYTICGDKHVSRVSASIMKHLKLGEYICDNEQMYIKKIIKHTPYSKINTRTEFLKYMNPDNFMSDYESKLLKVCL